jgi:hypothetical protein
MHKNLPLHLRLAGLEEAPAVRRLAELDSVAPLTGEILVALRGGEPVAALSLTDGRSAADPFRPTADALAILRAWAAQVAAPAGDEHRQRRPVRRRLLRAA